MWLALCLTAACTPGGGAQQVAPSVHAEPSSQPAVAQPPAPPVRAMPAQDPSVPGVAVGVQGAVSSAEHNATEAGIEILRRGGNAIDAAVAVGFALAVTQPSAGNLGGGGFMIVRTADGRRSAIDYRETAPSAATRDMYLDAEGNVTDRSRLGPLAAGIPGTVAGMQLAHKQYGSLPWADLLAPAIRLAREGHVVDEDHARRLERGVKKMREAGYLDSARHYESAPGQTVKATERWLQPALAQTLETIANDGADAFYRGALATKLADGVKSLGGIWTAADLADYRAKERKPIEFDYLGHHVISMPPPSAGGVVMRQILAGGQQHAMHVHPYRSVEATHLYLEATRRAYADRGYLLGDPDFAEVPTEKLTSDAYIEQRMRDIDPKKATPSSEVRGGLSGALSRESQETTHYSVVDAAGNAVSNTYTLNTGMGAKVVAPGTGVLLNNEMDDFAAKPGTPNGYGLVQGENNRIEPGKRMLSSMTPTIVTKDGELRAVLGSPGGPTITTTVTMILRAMIEHAKPLDQAVAAPRIHHQWLPDRAIVEEATEPALVEGLKALGHAVMPSRWGSIGHAHCIEVDPQTKGFRAVADVVRGSGSAMAY